MTVAALQRQWLERLERISPKQRPILAQTHKEHPWTPWRFLPVDAVLWTRSLLANELLFESDHPERSVNESTARRLAFALTLKGAKPLVADGGGKSWHVHVWLTGEFDAEAVSAAEAAGVDVWRVIRETVYDDVVKSAGLDKSAKLDRAKVAWSQDRKGSMVREFGTPGSTGRPKSLVGTMAMFPEGDPPLWDVSAYDAQIVKALRRAAAKPKHAAPTGGGQFHAHPCVATALKDGAPAGERNATGLHLLNLARAEGLTADEARSALQRYLAASGCDPNDKLLGRIAAVYEAPASAIACPNPLGLSVCATEGRCPKRPLRLSG